MQWLAANSSALQLPDKYVVATIGQQMSLA